MKKIAALSKYVVGLIELYEETKKGKRNDSTTRKESNSFTRLPFMDRLPTRSKKIHSKSIQPYIPYFKSIDALAEQIDC